MNTHVRDNLNALTDCTSVITTTGTQTALSIPTGRGVLEIRANNASLLTLQGITAPSFDGQILIIQSVGAGQVDIANQNGSASAANRIACGVTGTISLAAGSGRCMLAYDSTNSYWRVVHHEQGAWITPTFAAGDYTAETGNWTVDAGDVVAFRYQLSGRMLSVIFNIVGTDVSATPAYLIRAVPGGFTNTTAFSTPSVVVSNAGGATAVGLINIPASSTSMRFYATEALGAWSSTSSDNTFAIGTVSIEVT